jgi:hypothetical protein
MRRALLLCLVLPLCACGDGAEPAAPPAGPGPGDLDKLIAQIESEPYRYADAGPTRIRFTEATDASGLTAVNHSGRAGIKEFLLEAVGPGCAWLDFDGDGWLDVFVPDGDVFSNYVLEERTDPKTRRLRPLLVPKSPRPEPYRDALYRNNGDGTFTNVAAAAGIADESWSFGATAFDHDGDGRTDLFVSSFGPDRLWHNNGDGTFTDVAAQLGVQGHPWTWSTCAAAGDFDGDGRLDLYVVGYHDVAAEVERHRVLRGLPKGVPVEAISGRSCKWRGLDAYCGPLGLEAQHDTLYRQLPDGTFEDVTEAWGLLPATAAYGFTALAFDFNEDGLLDVYVANDSVENFMWQQERDRDGRLRFRDTATLLGCKYGSGLLAQAGMGAWCGDVDQDGLFDVFVTNFSHDYNNLYMGQRVPGDPKSFFFKDRGLALMAQAVYYDLSWGCGWWDFDNDADLDLFVANGHVYKEVELFKRTGTPYEQLNTMFECMEASPILGLREIGGKMRTKAPKGANPADLYAGDAMEVALCSRAAGFADYDNDGRLDILVLNMNEKPTLMRNTSDLPEGRNWVKLELSQPGPNREALGAILEVTTGADTPEARTQKFPVLRLSSFLGTDDPRIHVGLGEHTRCTVRVTWPGVERAQTTYEVEAGGLWRLHREAGRVEPRPLPTLAR